MKTCIFRAMSTGLKMQYPEDVKENGKKNPKKNPSCAPNQPHLFVWYNLHGKLCVGNARQRASSPAARQLVHPVGEMEFVSRRCSPPSPLEPALQLDSGLLPVKVGSCLWVHPTSPAQPPQLATSKAPTLQLACPCCHSGYWR